MKGSTFDSFLEEQNIKDETYSVATKRVLAWQIEQAMEAKNMTKKAMAASMSTSRTQLDRLLDPKNDRVQLDTIMKAAKVLGRRVRIEFVDEIASTSREKAA